ncbi:MAG: MFS transporter [Anaerohalosphaera sp.]|nr:MFS transporter [Anaerohalosphaera sp.]
MEKVVALLSVFGLGMCFSILGSISVKLMPRLKIDQGKFGSLISSFMFSCLIASLMIGVITDKVGYKPVATFGFVATAACIFIFARGKSYQSVLIPCILLGFGAMALNTAGNTLGPRVLFNGEDPVAASNLVNVFFGLGLFLTPLIVSFLFQKTTYEKAVSVLGVIVLLPAAVALMATYPASSAGFAIGDAVKLLAEPAVLLGAFVLFCYISLEASFCNWLPAFGKEVITTAQPETDGAVADASAQRLLSLFAIAMMVGRLAASKVVTPVNGSYVIAGAALVTAGIIYAMTITKCPNTSKILAIIAGLAFAPCFPTTVGVTFSKFDSSVYGSVFGIIFAVGLAGAVIVPKAIGNFAKGSSVQKSMKMLIPACILLIFLAIGMGMVKGPKSDAPVIPEAPITIESN